MKSQILEFKNGPNIVCVNAPSAQTFSVQIWFRVGSAMEGPQDFGMAHFLEHMFFKGTKKNPQNTMAKKVEDFGGELNAFTSFEYTCYFINGPKDFLLQALDLLWDMVCNPLFAEQDFAPEKEVVLEEYLRAVDSPSSFAFNNIQKKFFKGGYAHPILGNTKTIKNFSKKQLLAFRKKFYNKENCFILVASDLGEHLSSASDLKKIVKKYSLPSGPVASPQVFKTKSSHGNSLILVEEKDISLAQLFLYWPATAPLEKNSCAEEVALYCLGAGQSSRLYKILVQEKMLSHSLGASTLFLHSGGLHSLKVNISFDCLEKALFEIEKEIIQIIQRGLNKEELERLKNQFKASKIYEKELLESYAFSVGHSFASFKDLFFEEEYLERISQLRVEDLYQALITFLSRECCLQLLIPSPYKEEKEKATESLKKFHSNIMESLLPYKEKQKSDSFLSHKKNSKKSKKDPWAITLDMVEGIKLCHRQNPLSQTEKLEIYTPGGLIQEDKKNNGSYHLLSSLLMGGYSNYTEESLRERIHLLGCSLSMFSAKNAYGAQLSSLKEHFVEMVGHSFGSFFDSHFAETMSIPILQREKKIALESLDLMEKDPQKKVFSEFTKKMFEGHPYGLTSLGNPASLKEINVQGLEHKHKTALSENKMAIFYSGPREVQEVWDILIPHFFYYKIKNRKKPFQEKFFLEREQMHLVMGIPTQGIFSEEQRILKMLTSYLQGQGSPLFYKVRDELGLCYVVAPAPFVGVSGGYFSLYMGTSFQKQDLAIKTLQEEIQKLALKGLSAKEFQSIKNTLKGQFIMNTQTNDDWISLYSIPVFYKNSLDLVYENQKKIEEMSVSFFNKQLREILTRPWSLISVGR